MQINEVLAQFGLENKEDDVYLACLELGAASVNEIASKANIKRTTVYDVLKNLEAKGLIGKTSKGKKTLFYAEEPDKLAKLLDEKKNRLLSVLPILKSLYNTAGSKPRLRYYEGKNGLKEVYRDTLNYSGEIMAFVTGNIFNILGNDFAREYKAKRKKAKIPVRIIAPDTEEIRDELKTAAEDMRNARMVPRDKFPFTIEMNIYGNKIAFMSFKEGMGIIVESNEIADNMRLLFELAWAGAMEYKTAETA